MLEYSWKNSDINVIGEEHGINVFSEFDNYKNKITKIISSLYERKNNSGEWLQWMNFAYDEHLADEIKEYANQKQGLFDNILVIGVGGSALGAKCVTESLLPPYWNRMNKEQRENIPRLFFLDNIDPDQIEGLLNSINLKRTLVNVITKSGDTAEIMALYMLLKDKIEKELGDEYRNNFVATTDKYTGFLRQISEQEGYKTFEVPDDVCGRFSVFSAVGLLPFALLGIDIKEILRGVRDLDAILQNTTVNHNIAAQNALVHYLMDKKGKNISVIMPYSNRLKYFPEWYAHILAESTGKQRDLEGNIVYKGITPVKAIGISDQHSQIQLFNEGPNNKVITLIRVAEFDNTVVIPNVFEYTGLNYLCNRTFNSLLNAEAYSTKVVLNDNKRPNITITMPKINEYYIGQLLYFFEMQTAILGGLYNIDAFNQPGVEQAKNYTYGLMGRVGYEGSAEELKEKMTP